MAVIDKTYYKGTDLYSDGDETENSLMKIVQERKKLSDLQTEDVTWPIFYHLSPIRENICNWYPFQSGSRILEIGAGCGAVTGALIRHDAEVYSVDLSLRRSMINYERHKDAPNLHIMVGNLNDIPFEESFDYVLLIGVLEYAGRFTEGEQPYKAFLENIRKYLKPEGKLLIAIENRLGLKYFAGADEDHLAKAFAGLRGYDQKDGVHTFSRSELTELLEQSGLGYVQFYYPYPDYKFPTEIFTDETLKTNGYGKPYAFFDKNRDVLFPEEDIAAILAREGTVSSLANSFLAVASAVPAEENRIPYIHFETDKTEERFAKETRMIDNTRPLTVPPENGNEELICQLRENEERLQQEIRQKDADIQELRDRLESVLNSHSWRLTALPRKITGKILQKEKE